MFNIFKIQDVQIPDYELKKRYYKLFLGGAVDSAQKIYEDNPQLQGECLNAELLNQLLSAILELERRKIINVDDYLESEMTRRQISIMNLIYMQEYNNTKSYSVNNFVLYGDEIYYCYKTPPIGTLPTNSNYWIKLKLKGEKGTITYGVNYLGIYHNDVFYNEKDMVVYDNILYVAKETTSGQLPPDNPNVWLECVRVNNRIIYVSQTEPIMDVGDIWIKIL